MTTILELRDRLTNLLMDGVPADTPCVIEIAPRQGVRDIDLRRRPMTPIGNTGRYRRDAAPGSPPNSLMF